MKPKQFDIVLLMDGREATVLDVFDDGSAFLVEIADEKGRTIETPFVKKTDIFQILIAI